MKPHGEEFLVSVCYHRSPEQRIRRGDVMADMGFKCPDPPPTDAEMQEVAFAAKMSLCRVLRLRALRASRASRWAAKCPRCGAEPGVACHDREGYTTSFVHRGRARASVAGTENAPR